LNTFVGNLAKLGPLALFAPPVLPADQPPTRWKVTP
jgi:hypothetical protein